MEKDFYAFNRWIKESSFEDVFGYFESKKFPITLSVKFKSTGFLYLPKNELRDLLDKECITTGNLYSDINCTKIVRAKGLKKIKQRDLSITKEGHARLIADYLIHSFEVEKRKETNISESELKIFFSRESCSEKEAAYILCGVDIDLPVNILKQNRDREVSHFPEIELQINSIIARGDFDNMELSELEGKGLEIGRCFFEQKIFRRFLNFVVLFNSWLVKHPLYMAEEFCKMGITFKNFSAHERLIIKVLNDRKSICSEIFNQEFPYLSKFLEEDSEIEKLPSPIAPNYFSKLGKDGGSVSKKAEELYWLVDHLLDKKIGFTKFKRMLERNHASEAMPYEGIEGKCYDIYLVNGEIYYSTDSKEKQQSRSITSLKRYFTEVKELRKKAS